MLRRDETSTLTSCTIYLGDDIKPKRYREQRRQFAEAVLANAVLVVEGGTEVAAYLAVADVLDTDPAAGYQHPDLAGLSLFDAGSDSAVPGYGPVFTAMGKTVFGVHDTPSKPLTGDQRKKEESFAICLDIGYRGIEDLLVTEISPDVLRTFLSAVASRGDYPQHLGYLPDGATNEQTIELAKNVLKARKATEFAPLLIAECGPAQLPPTLVKLLLDINAHLAAQKLAGTATASEPTPQAAPAEDSTPDTDEPGPA